jgi:DNA-binding GntR family transcriptional regulator
MPVPGIRESVDRHLLRDTAYAKLCGAIVDGTLGPGESLSDGELCGWLGLSRTPIREALVRLRDEGLIEMEPQRYTRVSPVSVAEVQALVPLLAVLHGLATELGIPRMQPAQHRELRKHNDAFVSALRRSDAVGAFDADTRFHGVFVSASDNPEIPRVLARLMPRLQRLEHLSAENLPGRRSVAQHEAMISRAEMGDAAGAAAAARANWMTLGSVLERAFADA